MAAGDKGHIKKKKKGQIFNTYFNKDEPFYVCNKVMLILCSS